MTTSVLTGHVLDVLAGLPEKHYHCLVTSPPFYGLRAYGTEPQVWGGDAACEHEWGEESLTVDNRTMVNLHRNRVGHADGDWDKPRVGVVNRAFCRLCHAWRGELGAEATPDCLAWARGEPADACRVGCFLCHLRLVMAAVRRVLRDDGVAFVELGDGYSTKPAGNKTWNHGAIFDGRDMSGHQTSGRIDTSRSGIPAKSLILVPERFRLAMVADGWIVRGVIRWCRRAPMPESVRDRPTSAVSEVVMLTKCGKYFADLESVKERSVDGRLYPTWDERKNGGEPIRRGDPGESGYVNRGAGMGIAESGRNPRNYAVLDPAEWAPPPDYVMLSPEPSRRAHYASYGPRAITPLVKMATSESGCCGKCGAAYERVTEVSYRKHRPSAGDDPRSRDDDRLNSARGHGGWQGNNLLKEAQTTGWRPRCQCQAETRPCRVLDPFAGSGTTLVVAERLGLDATGIELNEEYARMARERIAVEGAPLFAGNGQDEAPTQLAMEVTL